jgi:WD40 repeat protein
LCLHDEASLWHGGCVNAASWNATGDLLCTGSDDRHVKVWNAWHNFSLREGGDVKTGHSGNIFHCAFVSQSGDKQVVTCAADGQLRLNDLGASSEERSGRLLHCAGATANEFMTFMFEWMPDAPVLLTAPEDGRVMRVDLRDPRPSLFLRQEEHGTGQSVKQLAFGHHSEHILAVGAEGPLVRLYDIRKLEATRPQSVCCFTPPRLAADDPTASGASSVLSRMLRNRAAENVSISGLKFAGDGRELLVSYHGDQIYAFDTNRLEQRPGIAPVGSFGGHINYETFLKTVTYFGPRGAALPCIALPCVQRSTAV